MYVRFGGSLFRRAAGSGTLCLRACLCSFDCAGAVACVLLAAGSDGDSPYVR